MPPFKIGYNINAEAPGANRQLAADYQIALHSTFTLVLDDYLNGKWFYTKQIQALSPETDITHRRYWYVDPNNPLAGGWDGSLHRAPGITAENIINTLEGEQRRGGVKVREQIYNEPNVHRTAQDPQGNELKTMLRLMVDCMKIASARDMRLAIDIGQPVTWVQAEFDAGFYDELIFTFAQHPEHVLCIHLYGLGDLWFNTSEARMAMLSLTGVINTAQYITQPDNVLKVDYLSQPDKGHFGREGLLAARARRIGTPVPKMVVYEVGWDRTRISQQSDVDAINGRPAMGYPTLAQYWKVRYPQWTQARTAFEQIKWLHRAMPDYIVGACLYGFDTSFENGNYHLQNADLQKYLELYSIEVRYGQSAPPVITPPPVVLPPAPNVRDAFDASEQQWIDREVKRDPQGTLAKLASKANWK